MNGTHAPDPAVDAGRGRGGAKAGPLRARPRPGVQTDSPGFGRTRALAVGNTAPVYAFAQDDCRDEYQALPRARASGRAAS